MAERLGLEPGRSYTLTLGESFATPADKATPTQTQRSKNGRPVPPGFRGSRGAAPPAPSSFPGGPGRAGVQTQASRGPTYHSIRYDFKPASLDSTQGRAIGLRIAVGSLAVDTDRKVRVDLPSCNGDGQNAVNYSGHIKEGNLKECVLLINPKTNEIVLERIASQIRVKKTRPERAEKGEGGLGFAQPAPVAPPPPPPPSQHQQPMKPSTFAKGSSFGRSSAATSGSSGSFLSGNNASGGSSNGASKSYSRAAPPAPKAPSVDNDDDDDDDIMSSLLKPLPVISPSHQQQQQQQQQRPETSMSAAIVEASGDVGILSDSSSSDSDSDSSNSSSSDDDDTLPSAPMRAATQEAQSPSMPDIMESMPSLSESPPRVQSAGQQPVVPMMSQCLNDDLRLSESDSDSSDEL